MEQLQALIEGPLKNLLSKKQLPFNETIKFQPEEIEDEHLGCVDSVLLECEMKKEGEVRKPILEYNILIRTNKYVSPHIYRGRHPVM